MARNRPNPLDHPPAASSSEEEEDEELSEQREEDKRPADSSGSEDEDEETDEDEPEEEKIRPPHKSVSKIPNPQCDESDTESESAAFAIRPHTSTPVSAAKPLKRPVEGDKESKSKAKKKAKPDIGGGEGTVSAKKSGSVKLWSDEDEVAVLKGMIEFRERKGIDPSSDYALFHEFLKKSISVDVSKSQLMEKIRRLRNKFRSSEEKEKSEDLVFSRPHDRIVFELAKTVWRSVGGESASVKKNSSADHNGVFDFGDNEVEEEIRPQHKPVSKTIEMKSGKKSGTVVMWSDEDVIAVLEGMIEFREKKGVDPDSDSTAFYEFVKKSISVDVSKSQLMDKVKALKDSYILNTGKGEDPVFSMPNARKVFGLSKIVWGSAGGDVVKKKTSSSDQNGKFDVVMALPKPNFNAFNTISKQEPHHSKVVEAIEAVEAVEAIESVVAVEQGKFADLYPFLYLSLKSSSLAMVSRGMAEIMERFLVSVDQSKLQELDKEWKKQILNEAQVSMGRSDLLKKQLQLLQADWHSTKG